MSGLGLFSSQTTTISRVAALCLAAVTLLLVAGCRRGSQSHSNRTVVIYTSQDQVYAEPILREFTRETGIEVRPLYDSEAVKTVGLVNRLLAESSNPQCDVFWNNEALRTQQLANRDLVREWKSVGFRSRRLVFNTNLLSLATAPRTFLELTNARWRGKVALAYPLFGTTATHFIALRQQMEPEAWITWCRALQENGPMILDGNSTVVKQVGRGEAWVGMTDSDDIAAGQREGLPIMAVPLSPDSLLIPNTIALMRSSPNPGPASELANYLARADIVQRLVAAGALEGAHPNASMTPTISPDWPGMALELDSAIDQLKQVFLR